MVRQGPRRVIPREGRAEWGSLSHAEPTLSAGGSRPGRRPRHVLGRRRSAANGIALLIRTCTSPHRLKVRTSTSVGSYDVHRQGEGGGSRLKELLKAVGPREAPDAGAGPTAPARFRVSDALLQEA